MKQSLIGLSLQEIENKLSDLSRMRVKQIYKWIIKGVNSFNEMSDIPAEMQQKLAESYCVFSSTTERCETDGDIKKIVIALKDGLKIEAVLLTDGKNRFTACLSTQVGCPLGCVFCKTGSIKFMRNLDYTEIIEQFFHLQNSVKNINNKKDHTIDNIVIMGMGEPLLNLDNLRKALDYFNDKNGLNYSRRRITVSTSGICESLFNIAENLPFAKLSLSLTTADEHLRKKLMPVTNGNPLKKVKEALFLFQKNGGGRITLEIPLLGDINTSEKDARLISEFAEGLSTIINIIPWNPAAGLEFEGFPLKEPEKNETANFIKLLENLNLKVTMRLHKGRKVLGACGQLGVISENR